MLVAIIIGYGANENRRTPDLQENESIAASRSVGPFSTRPTAKFGTNANRGTTENLFKSLAGRPVDVKEVAMYA
jgi:hypothetical protein